MSERVLAALLASLALMTGGCGGGSEPTAQAPATPGGATPSPSPAAQKPSVPAKPADAKDAKGKPDTPATAKGPNGKSPAVAGGLTRSTDPDERAQEVQGRIKAGGAAKTDPFSALPVTPVLKADSEGAAAGNSSIAKAGGAATAAEARAGSGGLTSSDTANGGTTPIPPLPPLIAQGIDNLPEIPVNIGPALPPISIASLPIGGSSTPTPSPRGASPQPVGGGAAPRSSPGTTTAAVPLPPPIPALPSQGFEDLPSIPVNIGPPLPPADLGPQSIAENIGVSGVAQVGDRVQVIVQLPGGLTRYVGLGDLIANGQVLVKRVEGLGSSDPIVILEEEGVEYPRALGTPVVAMDENSDRG
jgi:hypothetical protein